MAVSRKTVTVLFADLADSTGLGERLDAELVRGLLSRWFEEARSVVERHGGTVEKFIGDAVMAVFGIPQAHEDDAVRALRAASELQRALSTLSNERADRQPFEVGLRVGVNTGEVVTGGSPEQQSSFVTGDAVNVAKRLEEAAQPGQVLVGAATERFARHAARFELLGPLELKGKSGAVEAWRLVGVTATDAPVDRRHELPFVGRHEELTLLRAAYESAVARRVCRRFTVLGAAGVGKSRLAYELLDELRDRATVLSGRCLPYGEGITFWPLQEMIRELGGEDGVRRLFASSEEGDLVRERLTEPGGSDETFWAVRRLCETLALARPLVLCFEDVHWAEPMLLDLVEYLVGWSRDAAVLVLCLARPEFVDKRPTFITDQGGSSALNLQPLGDLETSALLDVLAISGDARDRIAEAAAGNPLYVEQMAAMVLEAGYDDEFLVVPPTIQALLAARLDRLSAEERRAVECAAVVGKEFSRRAVAELIDEDGGAQVGRHLMSLVRKDLIRPHRSNLPAEDAFRFAHALVRDAAYAGLPKQARAVLHARFADWLARRASALDTELDEIIGYHLEQAFRYRTDLAPVDREASALADRASSLLGKAGRRAFARDDVSAAVKLLDRAVSLATEERPAQIELRRELSLALWSLGEVARAEALLDGVIEAAGAHGNRRLQWYSVLDRLGQSAMTDPDGSDDDALGVAQEGLRVFEELGDDLGQAHASRQISAYWQTRGQFGAAGNAAERALKHARLAGDGRLEARSTDSLCTCLLYGPARARHGIAVCRDLLARTSAKPLLEANVLASLAGFEGMQGTFVEARAHVRRAELIYGELGLRLAEAGLRQVAASVELLADEPARAEDVLLPAMELLEGIGAHGYTGLLLAEALCAQERYGDAAKLLARVEPAIHRSEIATRALFATLEARLAAREGDEQAVEQARTAVALASSTDGLNLRGDALAGLADVLCSLRQPADAASAMKEALGVYERKENVAAAGRCRRLLPTLVAV